MRRCHKRRGGSPGVRLATATTLLVVVAALTGCTPVESPPEPVDTPPADATTAAVERQDLTIQHRLPGRLGFGDAFPLVAGREGVVTWMPDVGSVIGRGETVVEIDGRLARLLVGDRPAWRRLAVGELDGPDIRQLNDNLAAMGHADRGALPNDEFDWRTREAVKDWQEHLGMRRTGAFELGDVVFLPSKFRVGNPEIQLGMRVGPGQTLYYATGTEQIVTTNLDPALLGDVRTGSVVSVVMPDRSQVEGTVRSIGREVADTEPDGDPAVAVIIEFGEEPSTARRFDTAPVSLLFETELARDVLVVPVGALLASAEGGYSVELVTEGGTKIVAVEPGQFADGLVEITGDVDVGDEVVVP